MIQTDSIMAAPCCHPNEKSLTVVNLLQTLASDCNKMLRTNNNADNYEKSETLSKCSLMCNEGLSGNISLKHQLQLYAKAMLDFTFYTESILTETDFPEHSSEEKVRDLLKQLEKPVELCQELFPQEQVGEILGAEIYECICWRQGALLYMYCSTVNDDAERRNRTKDMFNQNLLKGIHYLSKMFLVRKCQDNEEFQSNCQHTINLIKKGIYSDTHLLSLMYKGDLCNWYLQSCNTETSQGTDRSIDVISEGRTALETFIQITDGPLKNQGWSSERAKELLKGPQFTR
ncbi:UPF0600 protein C5orf51 homolog isoform X1 [Octopus sinensis]|uniref:UPF0600 protein C5orf51 homolog isoform X1 n=1 Tax=Octopus sinensis TaxID=2607531 RepID=A0A6P7SRL3_9MOLL|nr:UPF0600 protein C5orf51 homolog isoform X1 [Octopus sinensis]